MDLQKEIKNLLLSKLSEENVGTIKVEVHSDSKKGDYTTAVALEGYKFFKDSFSSPYEFANSVVNKINTEKPDWLEKVEAAGPGFINFYVNKDILSENILKRAISKDFANYSNQGKNKVIVEHTSVNPNKAMHIGHLRNAFIGDSIVKILKKFDFNVEVHNYIDDTGVQVADTTLAVLELKKPKPEDQAFDDYAWDIYSEINQLYETDLDLKAKREEISKLIEKADNKIFTISQEIVHEIVGKHLELMCHFDIKYDLLVYESDVVRSGFWNVAFEKLKNSENFYLESEGDQKGCWVLKYKNNKFGNKIFVRSNGTVVYTGKDLAYHLWKFGALGKDFGYVIEDFGVVSVSRTASSKGDKTLGDSFGSADIIVTVVDERQEYPQEMVRYALEALGYQRFYNNYNHLSYGVVNLSLNTAKELGINIKDERNSYAMSGRKGIGVKAKEVLSLLESKVKEQNTDSDYRKIASGALKHYMLKYNTSTEIVFDYETALNLKGNTGPYLQYSYARAFNILSKVESFNPTYKYEGEEYDANSIELIKLMGEWPDILEKVSKDFMLSYIADYAFRLSSSFHKFYETNNVLKSNDEVRDYRLTIVQSYVNTIRDVLEVMGIEVMEEM